MRKIEFNDLKLKNISDEETFYQTYIKNLQENVEFDNVFQLPTKKYEICYLNILDGKLILINKDNIINKDYTDSELFYDYSLALKAYNLMLDIENGIEDEKNEFNELYKDERLQKGNEIEQLKKQDNILFNNKKLEYNSIINSDMYKKYSKLAEENEQLKLENEKLKKEINILVLEKNTNIGFFKKFINKLKNKKLPKN